MRQDRFARRLAARRLAALGVARVGPPPCAQVILLKIWAYHAQHQNLCGGPGGSVSGHWNSAVVASAATKERLQDTQRRSLLTTETHRRTRGTYRRTRGTSRRVERGTGAATKQTGGASQHPPPRQGGKTSRRPIKPDRTASWSDHCNRAQEQGPSRSRL